MFSIKNTWIILHGILYIKNILKCNLNKMIVIPHRFLGDKWVLMNLLLYYLNLIEFVMTWTVDFHAKHSTLKIKIDYNIMIIKNDDFILMLHINWRFFKCSNHLISVIKKSKLPTFSNSHNFLQLKKWWFIKFVLHRIMTSQILYCCLLEMTPVTLRGKTLNSVTQTINTLPGSSPSW